MESSKALNPNKYKIKKESKNKSLVNNEEKISAKRKNQKKIFINILI